MVVSLHVVKVCLFLTLRGKHLEHTQEQKLTRGLQPKLEEGTGKLI
jgi:hypothetical protein